MKHDEWETDQIPAFLIENEEFLDQPTVTFVGKERRDYFEGYPPRSAMFHDFEVQQE